jgi:hypothetical protein
VSVGCVYQNDGVIALVLTSTSPTSTRSHSLQLSPDSSLHWMRQSEWRHNSLCTAIISAIAHKTKANKALTHSNRICLLKPQSIVQQCVVGSDRPPATVCQQRRRESRMHVDDQGDKATHTTWRSTSTTDRQSKQQTKTIPHSEYLFSNAKSKSII